MKMLRNLVFIIITIISIFVMCACHKTDNFTITGIVANAENKEIVLDLISKGSVSSVATTKIQLDGSFKFSYSDTVPHFYRLHVENSAPIYLCLKNGDNVEVKTQYPEVNKSYEISGSEDNIQLQKLNARLQESLKTVEELRSKINQEINSNPNLSDSLKQQSYTRAEKLYQSDRQFVKDFIIENQNSPIIYLAMYQYVGTTAIFQIENDFDVFSFVLDKMKQNFPQMEETRMLESVISKYEQLQKQQNHSYLALKIGDEPPSLSMTDINGNVFVLENCCKPVSVCFWASWDKAIIEKIKLYIKDNPNKNIVLVSLDMNLKDWQNAIERHKFSSYTNLCDGRSWEGISAKMYGITQLPTIIEINDDNKISNIVNVFDL